MIGQTISHYTILEKLGEGGMGVVYKAHDTELDRDVALKFLPGAFTSDTREKDRFYHEARAASALNHPNITTIYEIKEYEGQLYLAMELIEGKTLKQIAEAEPLSLEKVLDIAIQVCEGLKAAHQKKIVHRDIKSANIMLTPSGQVKIMDFGLAKMQGASKLTMTGSTIGTAAYMSPEQARGEEVDHRTDIFSFGVVLYELLAGRLPFRGEHPAALMYSIVNEDPQPISKFNDKVPAEIEQIVLRALAKDREERYQNVDELLADLRSEQKRLEYPNAAYTPKVRATARPKRSLVRIGIVAAAALLLVVLALIFNPFNLNTGFRKNVVEAKPYLAVIGFENVPEPADTSFYGEMLTNYLITALGETKALDVVSREHLYTVQNEMGEGDSKKIAPSVAEEIARRAGASTMLLASILQVEPSWTITYRVVDVHSGKIMNTRRLGGYTKDKTVAMVDTLALLVKGDLNIRPVSGTLSRSVAEVTTKSPEAYRAYVEAMEMFRRMRIDQMMMALQKAVELDSTFAMAHYYLGWHDISSMRRAWMYRTNATDVERLQIEAWYDATIGENPLKAADLLEQAIQKYPHERLLYFQAWYNFDLRLCDFDRAGEALERGLKNDSTDKILWTMLPYYYGGTNKRAEALSALDKYIQLAPTEWNPYDTKGDILLSLGEPDSAIQWWLKSPGSSYAGRALAYYYLLRRDYEKAMEYFREAARKGDEIGKAWAETDTVFMPFHRGELLKAGQLLNRHLKKYQKDKALRPLLTGWIFDQVGIGDLYNYLVTVEYEKGNFNGMLRYARERSQEIIKHHRVGFEGDPMSPVNGRYEVAWALLKNGKAEESSRLMDELREAQRPGMWVRQREFDYFSGLLAFERGKFDVAVEQFDKSFSKFRPNRGPDYHYAVALLKNGRLAEAIQEFRQLTWRFNTDIYYSPTQSFWPIAAVKAHYWLGVAFEQQGKRREAIKEYETFLDTWKNADFKSAEMEDARTRLGTLKGATTM